MESELERPSREAKDPGDWTVKGSGVKPFVRFCREVGGEEVFQRILARLSRADRQLFGQNIMTVGDYKTSSVLALLHATVDEMFAGDAERAAEIGSFIMDEGLNVIYTTFIKVRSQQWLISKAPLLYRIYQSVGSLTPYDVGPKCARARFEHPFLDKAVCRCIAGCVVRALQISGADGVLLAHERCIERGDPQCIYHLTWK